MMYKVQKPILLSICTEFVHGIQPGRYKLEVGSFQTHLHLFISSSQIGQSRPGEMRKIPSLTCAAQNGSSRQLNLCICLAV
jgi:hypothetical protein